MLYEYYVGFVDTLFGVVCFWCKASRRGSALLLSAVTEDKSFFSSNISFAIPSFYYFGEGPL
jgi:hypothetical protein